MGKTAAVILFLAVVAAAAPFAPGTRFGMFGLDLRPFFGDLYYSYNERDVGLVDPLFRAGVYVRQDLALGAEMALFNTIPLERDMFTSTPVFVFGPSAIYVFEPGRGDIRPYTTAGVGASYAFVPRRLGWRWKLGAGALLVTGSALAFGLEAGWYEDWARAPRWTGLRYALVWQRGDAGFIGVRIMGIRW